MQWIDLAQGEKTFGDSETARSMLDLFIGSLEQSSAQLQSLYNARHWQSLYEQVHSFHGACCYSSTPILLSSVKQLHASLQIIVQSKTEYNDDIHKSIGDHLKRVLNDISKTSAYYRDYFANV